MQLAVSSRSFHRQLSAKQMGLWDVPGEARVLGLPGIELADTYLYPPGRGLFGKLLHHLSPSVPIPPDRAYDSDLLRRVQRSVQYYHMTVVAWSCDSNLGEPALLAQSRAYARLALQTASQFGALVLCITVDHQAIEQNLVPVVETLGLLAVDAERAGVRLALANHTPAADVDCILGIIQGVNSYWLGACADFGNFRPGRAEEDFERLAARAIHARARSCDFDASGQETSIPYWHRLSVLRTLGYSGAIAIEYAGTRDPAEGIRQTKDLIRRYWS